MCGIIGYIGQKQAQPILEKGLERLEYRGYDSVGLAVLDTKGFQIVKKPGNVAAFKKALQNLSLKGNLGLGHTRWATHGEVNESNAHPHWDCKKEIVLVHNGIIENFKELKEELLVKGHRFRSDTDTEVIAHLIEEYYAGDLARAVLKALPELKGSYAIVVASKKEPDKIIAARSLSPLVLGIGREGYYVASDATALIDETRSVIYLEEGEMAVLRKGSLEIKDIKGNIKQRTPLKVTWDVSGANKNGFPHFMLKEIQEQPEVVKKILAHSLKQDRISLGLEQGFLKGIRDIYIVACGTAYHAGLIAEYLIENFVRLPVTVDTSSEFRYRNPILGKGTLFICISQSGETADTLAGLRLAKQAGLRTLAIVNVENSTIARRADKVIYTEAGPEIGVASTKAYLAQIAILQLLTLKLVQVNKTQDRDFLKEYLREFKKIPLYLEQLLLEKDTLRSLSQELSRASSFLYMARGINYPNALEGALKLKEISYIHAEGYPGGEMKHGPIALVEKGLPVIAIVPQGAVRDKMISNMLEIKARQGEIIGIITEGDKEAQEISKHYISLPSVREELSVLLVPIPLQLLAYYIALQRGSDVDRPRNLAKSVTVE